MEYNIRPINENDRPWVLEFIRGGGADFIITRGRIVYPHKLEAFVAVNSKNERVGLATYEIIGDQCELVTLDAFTKYSGIGSDLVKKVREVAVNNGCSRLWLITTNDNIDAIRFYQRRGFTLATVHANALELSRKLKPTIPKIGYFRIPMRDEIEFEMLLR